jgi:hypothetical protein
MQDRPSKHTLSPEPDHEARRPEDQQAPDLRAFNPWRRTRKGTAARRVSEAVLALLTDREKRKRQRKAADVETFAEVLDAVVASLLRYHLDPDQQRLGDVSVDEKRGWVRIPLSSRRLTGNAQRSRYDATPMPLGMLMTTRRRGKPERRGIIDNMADLELIWLDRAPRHSEATRASAIKCRDRLLDLIAEHEPRLEDLELLSRATTADGKLIEPELIELRIIDDDPDDPQTWGKSRRQSSKPIEYPDSECVSTLRDQLRRINAGLEAASITFDPGTGVINGYEVPEHGVALGDRTLKRIFNNGRWNHGGRLYGGFWQEMKRELRGGLRIEGQPVVTLDFSAMYVQLLYAMKAVEQPPLDGDLYEGIDPVEGWPADVECKKAMRDAIKENVNAMMFPKPWHEGKPYRLLAGSSAVLSKGMTGTLLEERVKAKHPAIAEWLRVPEIGFELMHHESEIMIKTVLSCLDQGVTVLPIHDGLLVAEPHREVARTAMLEAFREYTGGFVARVSG